MDGQVLIPLDSYGSFTVVDDCETTVSFGIDDM